MGQTEQLNEQFEDPTFDDESAELDVPSEAPDSVDSPTTEEAIHPSELSGVEPPAPRASVPRQETGGTPTASAPPPPAQAPPYQPYQPPQQEAPKFYTRQELRGYVEQGIIDEDQMAEVLERQNLEKAKIEAQKAYHEQQRSNLILSQLNEYSQLVPGWNVVGQPANTQAAHEYQRLLNLGHPQSDLTRLAALENTFGTLQRIKEARATQARTNQERQTPPVSGRRGGTPPSSTTSKDPLKAISREQLGEYKKLIDKGLYPGGWNEVREELRYVATKQNVNREAKAKLAGVS